MDVLFAALQASLDVYDTSVRCRRFCTSTSVSTAAVMFTGAAGRTAVTGVWVPRASPAASRGAVVAAGLVAESSCVGL